MNTGSADSIGNGRGSLLAIMGLDWRASQENTDGIINPAIDLEKI